MRRRRVGTVVGLGRLAVAACRCWNLRMAYGSAASAARLTQGFMKASRHGSVGPPDVPDLFEGDIRVAGAHLTRLDRPCGRAYGRQDHQARGGALSRVALRDLPDFPQRSGHWRL